MLYIQKDLNITMQLKLFWMKLIPIVLLQWIPLKIAIGKSSKFHFTWPSLKGSPDQTHLVFEIIVGKSRIHFPDPKCTWLRPNYSPKYRKWTRKRYKLVQYSLMREIHDVKKVPEMNMTRRDSYNDLFQAVDGAILLYCVFIFSMTIFYHMMLEYAKWSSFKESPEKQYII